MTLTFTNNLPSPGAAGDPLDFWDFFFFSREHLFGQAVSTIK